LRTAWHSRNKRPLPESIQFTLSKFEKIWIVDGSTLEAIFRKLQSLEEAQKGQLAGKMSTVIDLMTSSINGIQLQIWATWLFYAVLVDLGDAVADEVSLPFDDISLEMIYGSTSLTNHRGLYHFTMAHQKGKDTDPVKYFADPQNRDLGIIKQKRKPNVKLIVAPFPELQRGTDQFFFSNFLKAS
jgi:hypothetical protein